MSVNLTASAVEGVRHALDERPDLRAAANLTASPVESVRQRLSEVVAGCLGLALAEIDPHEPLALYGLDSLRSVELGAELEGAFRRPLPDGLLSDHPSIDALVRFLEDGDPLARARHDDRNLDRMRADGVLPFDIHPEAAPAPVPASAPARSDERVLLTGATGFLGAHLLGTLLTETGAEVLCLVRSRGSGEAPWRRVRGSLERYRLWDDAFISRIHTVTGDLWQPGLGLAAGGQATIASTVDTVYHAAADVDWVSPYGALRAANVIGTRELLRLACRGRPKAFHFISSLSVCHAVGGRRFVAEDDDLLGGAERLPIGYAQTKCVAEALVRQARARGLRASIHRPALLACGSVTGVSRHDDLVSSLFKGCIEMGTAPDLDWRIDAVPVDQAARAIVHLSANASREFAAFHESAPRPRHWRECVLWMNLYGYPVRLVPFDDWAGQLARDAARPGHALHRLRGFLLRRWKDGTAVPELYEEGRGSAPRSARTQGLVSRAGLELQRLDAALLERCFDEFVSTGFLPPPRRRRRAPAAGAPASTADVDRARLEPMLRPETPRRSPGPTTSTGRARLEPMPRPGTPRRSPGPAAAVDRARLEPMLRRHFADDSMVLTGVSGVGRASEHSVIGELGGWRGRGRIGLFRRRLELAGRDGARTLDVVLKVKPHDRVPIEVAETAAGVCEPRLGRAVRRYRDRIGLRGSHLRELALYAEPDERLRRHTPVCYGTWGDDEREEWGLVLERLGGDVLIDATDDPAAWTAARVGAALDGLAEIHAVWLGREADLLRRRWIGHVATSGSMVEMRPLWRALAAHARGRLAEWAGPSVVRTHRALVESVGTWWPLLETAPRALIHNDFSPRNVAIREGGASPRLCAYDWELATMGAPQCDLAHFLCFVLDPDAPGDRAARYVERHRAALAAAAGRPVDPRRWEAGFAAALADLLVNRMMFYVMIDRVRPLPFLPRILRTWRRLHDRFGAAEGNPS